METLASEVLLEVLWAVEDGYVSACELVCRRWAALTGEPSFWRELLRRHLQREGMEGRTVVEGRWKEAYFALVRRNPKRATVVILGPERSGKSTLYDALYEACGVETPLSFSTAAQSGKLGRSCLIAMPNGRRVTLVDFPGACAPRDLCSEIAGAHSAILTIDGDGFEAGKRDIIRLGHMAHMTESKHPLIAFTKEDQFLGDKTDRLRNMIEEMSLQGCQYVRVSAKCNLNVAAPSDDLATIPLLEALDRRLGRNPVRFADESALKPLRFYVRKVRHCASVDKKEGTPKLGPNEALVYGTLISGFVCVGDVLAIAPFGVRKVRVVQIGRHGNNNEHMLCDVGERAVLLVSFDPEQSFTGADVVQTNWFKKKYIKKGTVLGRDEEISEARPVQSFQILVRAVAAIRRTCDLRIILQRESVLVRWEVLQRVDPDMLQVLEERPSMLRPKEWGIARVVPKRPLYLDPSDRSSCLVSINDPRGCMPLRPLMTTMNLNGFITRRMIGRAKIKDIEWSSSTVPPYLALKKPPSGVGKLIVEVLSAEIDQQHCPMPRNLMVGLGLRCGCVDDERTLFPNYFNIFGPARETKGVDSTYSPVWNETITFARVYVGDYWLWVEMREKGTTAKDFDDKTYGRAKRIQLTGLLSCKKPFLRIRLPMSYKYRQVNYLNLRLRFEGDPNAAPGRKHNRRRTRARKKNVRLVSL